MTAPIAPRWSGQDTYADLIESIAAANDVPRELAYGLIAQESAFNPNAVRAEPSYYCARTQTTGDASYGLTQMLYCTALGLNYTGQPTGLLDPATNLSLGLMDLGQLIASHGGDVSAALSAYNGGDRPSQGYGSVLPSGQFANQSYVDNVLNNTAYFTDYLAARDAAAAGDITDSTDTGDTVDATDGSSSGATLATVLASGVALAAIGVLLARRFRH